MTRDDRRPTRIAVGATGDAGAGATTCVVGSGLLAELAAAARRRAPRCSSSTRRRCAPPATRCATTCRAGLRGRPRRGARRRGGQDGRRSPPSAGRCSGRPASPAPTPSSGVGGGAVTDLAGFVAATWLRGVGWCRCPPRCWPWSTPRSAARPASTPPRARTWSAPSTRPRGVLCDLATLETLPPQRPRGRAGRGGQVRVHRRPGDPRPGRGRPEAAPTRDACCASSSSGPSRSRPTWWRATCGSRRCARSSTTGTPSGTRSSASSATSGGTARPSASGMVFAAELGAAGRPDAGRRGRAASGRC